MVVVVGVVVEAGTVVPCVVGVAGGRTVAEGVVTEVDGVVGVVVDELPVVVVGAMLPCGVGVPGFRIDVSCWSRFPVEPVLLVPSDELVVPDVLVLVFAVLEVLVPVVVLLLDVGVVVVFDEEVEPVVDVVVAGVVVVPLVELLFELLLLEEFEVTPA